MNWLPREGGTSRKEINIFLSGVHSPWGPCLECFNFPPLNPSYLKVKILPQWLLSSPSILGRFPRASRTPAAPRAPEKSIPLWCDSHSVKSSIVLMENESSDLRKKRKILFDPNLKTVTGEEHLRKLWELFCPLETKDSYTRFLRQKAVHKWRAMSTLHNPDLSALWPLTRSRKNVIC